MDDEQGRHRGSAHPLEFPIGRWTLLAVLALVAGSFVFDDTGWRFAAGVGLFLLSMAGFYVAHTLIKRVARNSRRPGRPPCNARTGRVAFAWRPTQPART